MKEDPIIAELRQYRAEHAKKYGNDLGRIVEALKEIEKKSGREFVYPKAQPTSPKEES